MIPSLSLSRPISKVTSYFLSFESKKARILRERREALAATLTDDMLFNLFLVDCTNKPRLPDNASTITRKRISKVPIDWEPGYSGGDFYILITHMRPR